MAVSSEKFEMAQDDLDAIMDKVLGSLEQFESGGRGRASNRKSLDQFQSWNQQTRSELMEAKKLIDEMEQEARMAPINYRGEMMGKVRQYREDVARIQGQIRMLSDAFEAKSAFGRGTTSRTGASATVHLNDEERYRRQVEEASTILDRTTQSVIR